MVLSASLLILVIKRLAQGAATALPSKMKKYNSSGYAINAGPRKDKNSKSKV